MKKSTLFYAIALITYLSCIGCFIWAIVEFIIYLVKDKPFNWLSLWICGASVVIALVSFVLGVVYEAKTDSNLKISKSKPSKFQQRLDEMIKSRNNNLNQN